MEVANSGDQPPWCFMANRDMSPDASRADAVSSGHVSTSGQSTAIYANNNLDTATALRGPGSSLNPATVTGSNLGANDTRDLTKIDSMSIAGGSSNCNVILNKNINSSSNNGIVGDISNNQQRLQQFNTNNSNPTSSTSAVVTTTTADQQQQQNVCDQQQQTKQTFSAPVKTQPILQQQQQQELTYLFECPVCFDHVTPPIIQCQNGHLVCKSCRTKITLCPTCRVPISALTIRNLQLERLASTLLFPCKYNASGCELKLTCSQKPDHEQDCEFRPYKCPCPGTACKWFGPVDQVMEHLTQQHKSITTLSGEDIVFLATDINLNGAVDWVMVQSCFDQHFLLVLEKQGIKPERQQFFAVVLLIGPQRLTENFSYRLELNGNRRRLQWEGTPRSICEGVQNVISSCDCLVFDSKMTKHFSPPLQKEGVNLGINVTISRVVDSAKPDIQNICESSRSVR